LNRLLYEVPSSELPQAYGKRVLFTFSFHLYYINTKSKPICCEIPFFSI